MTAPCLIVTIIIFVLVPANCRDVSNQFMEETPSSELQVLTMVKVGKAAYYINETIKEQPFEEISRERRRGKSLCKRRLKGRCVRRRKRCPGRLPSQTSPGKPFCSKFHRCCHPATCSVADGFFSVPGSGNQCFKFFAYPLINWDNAKLACEAEGLELAKPINGTAIRNFMVGKFGTFPNNFAWLGGRGTGSSIAWIRDGSDIDGSDPAWSSGQLVYNTNDYCLSMAGTEYIVNNSPFATYFMGGCSYITSSYVCELVA